MCGAPEFVSLVLVVKIAKRSHFTNKEDTDMWPAHNLVWQIQTTQACCSETACASFLAPYRSLP